MKNSCCLGAVSVVWMSLLIVGSAAAGTIIHVPADQPTIQAAINAANNGDAVLVSPGTYIENINFLGKAISVKSSNGPSVTTISSNGPGSIVTFNKSEGAASILSGFTLAGGSNTNGISVASASPTIVSNRIVGNHSCDGAGIYVNFGSPKIKGNTIHGNFHDLCSGGVGGGGIALVGAGSAQIIGNVISGNNGGNGFSGGGISLFAAGTPTIMNNIIINNTMGSSGGAIGMANQSDATIVQNLIYGNSAPQGSGIYFLVPSGDRGPLLVNNTIIAGSGATQGTAVFAGGFDNQVQFYNNLLIGLSGQNAVYCDNTYSSVPPTFTNNDAYSPGGTGLQGTCAGEASQNGNISLDPMFVNPAKNNYKLQFGSPAINTGDNSAPDLPKKDLAGKTRIVGGTIDMGAYEFQ